MSAAAPALRHDALLYGSDGAFVDALAPFVRDGLAAGEDVIAVTTAANISALRGALGDDASAVTFVDAADWYRHPARTIAQYREMLDQRAAEGADGVRVVGEVRFGPDNGLHREWVRYEAALNEVFADDRAWIVCPYDERALPPWVLRHAARTHRTLIRDGAREASESYTDPRELLARMASPPPARSAPPLAELPVDGDLAVARMALRDAGRRAGMPDDRIHQLTVAVNEALTNALTHGKPPVWLRAFRANGSLVCEVEDAGGAMSDLLAGYAPPAPGSEPESGMGLWVARQLCDHVAVYPADDRTVVRLAKSLRGE